MRDNLQSSFQRDALGHYEQLVRNKDWKAAALFADGCGEENFSKYQKNRKLTKESHACEPSLALVQSAYEWANRALEQNSHLSGRQRETARRERFYYLVRFTLADMLKDPDHPSWDVVYHYWNCVWYYLFKQNRTEDDFKNLQRACCNYVYMNRLWVFFSPNHFTDETKCSYLQVACGVAFDVCQQIRTRQTLTALIEAVFALARCTNEQESEYLVNENIQRFQELQQIQEYDEYHALKKIKELEKVLSTKKIQEITETYTHNKYTYEQRITDLLSRHYNKLAGLAYRGKRFEDAIHYYEKVKSYCQVWASKSKQLKEVECCLAKCHWQIGNCQVMRAKACMKRAREHFGMLNEIVGAHSDTF